MAKYEGQVRGPLSGDRGSNGRELWEWRVYDPRSRESIQGVEDSEDRARAMANATVSRLEARDERDRWRPA